MNISQPMFAITKNTPTKPVRYIAITGSTAKSCTKLKSLLKLTSYYCLVDCYKNSDDMFEKESFYLPDCVILEIRSLHGLFSINKKTEKLKEVFPGIKVVLFYNMLRKYPLLQQRNWRYAELHSVDDEQKQLHSLEYALQDKQPPEDG